MVGAAAIEVSGTLAYVTNAGISFGLKIVDVAIPETPTVLGSVVTPRPAEDIALDGTYAFLACETSGLQVVDVTTSAAPVIVGSAPGEFSGIALSGSHAFMADDGTQSLTVIDISTPESPVVVASVAIPVGNAGTGPHGVRISGSFAYVTDPNSGLHIVDITAPEAPLVLGGIDTDGVATGAAISGDLVFIADGTAGLQIVRPQCEPGVSTPSIAPLVSRQMPVGYPNPFSSGTRISFGLTTDARVALEVFDAGGRRVVSRDLGWLQAGRQDVGFDGRDREGRSLAPGIWFLRLRSTDGATTALRLVRLP